MSLAVAIILVSWHLQGFRNRFVSRPGSDAQLILWFSLTLFLQ